MAVYEATMEDLATITFAAEVMHIESPVFQDIPFKRDVTLEYVRSHIDEESKVIFIAKDETGIVGAIGGALQPIFFGSEVQAYETCFYVLPHLRGGNVGTQLFAKFIEWAESRGALRVWTGSHTGLEAGAYKAIVSGLGFISVGESFIRDGRLNSKSIAA